MTSSIGVKYDNEKPDLIQYFKKIPFKKKDFKYKKYDIEYVYRDDLLPGKAIIEINKVLSYGAKKYSPDNWKNVKPFKLRYFGALLRHLFQWYILKEKNDKETRLNHLAQAGCCLLFLLEKEIKR
jgi:hypothetical protein